MSRKEARVLLEIASPYLILLLGMNLVERQLASRHRAKVKRALRVLKDASLSTESSTGDVPGFPVAYASEEWFTKGWKLWASEAAGLLHVESKRWVFEGFLHSGGKVRIVFPRKSADLSRPGSLEKVRYEGQLFWPQAVHWLSLHDGDRRHYLAAVTESEGAPSKKEHFDLCEFLRMEQLRDLRPDQGASA